MTIPYYLGDHNEATREFSSLPNPCMLRCVQNHPHSNSTSACQKCSFFVSDCHRDQCKALVASKNAYNIMLLLEVQLSKQLEHALFGFSCYDINIVLQMKKYNVPLVCFKILVRKCSTVHYMKIHLSRKFTVSSSIGLVYKNVRRTFWKVRRWNNNLNWKWKRGSKRWFLRTAKIRSSGLNKDFFTKKSSFFSFFEEPRYSGSILRGRPFMTSRNFWTSSHIVVLFSNKVIKCLLALTTLPVTSFVDEPLCDPILLSAGIKQTNWHIFRLFLSKYRLM